MTAPVSLSGTLPQPPPSQSSHPFTSSSEGSSDPSAAAIAGAPSAQTLPPPLTRSSRSRRHSLPFVFPPPFQPNASSTSLISSTAEGRPIPLDDSTAAHRTTALRELNRTQPSSRTRYARSSAAPSITSTTTGTYSQPVIVRTYSGPPPSASSSRPANRRVPLSSVSITSSVTNWRPGRNGMVISMARPSKGKKKQSAQQRLDDAKLPPLEAFTFKSIMADMQQDIGADLDRIAEICARSRYSLSNQYEVHVAPHGSGADFMGGSTSSSSKHHTAAGPTLQAITSDDEHTSSTRHRRRRGAVRNRGAAYGTLETIMSSSRSSDEDKTKKKSAAEIAQDVRGRARQGSNESNSPNSTDAQASSEQKAEQRKIRRRKSTSFVTAVMDSSRSSQAALGDIASPRSSGTALVSEPAIPQTSRNHLEIRTSPEDAMSGGVVVTAAPEERSHETSAQPSQAVVSDSTASAAIASPEEPRMQPSLLSGLSSWIPWRASTSAVTEVTSSDQKKGSRRSKSYAEGTLRELLKTVEPSSSDPKGKDVERGL